MADEWGSHVTKEEELNECDDKDINVSHEDYGVSRYNDDEVIVKMVV